MHLPTNSGFVLWRAGCMGNFSQGIHNQTSCNEFCEPDNWRHKWNPKWDKMWEKACRFVIAVLFHCSKLFSIYWFQLWYCREASIELVENVGPAWILNSEFILFHWQTIDGLSVRVVANAGLETTTSGPVRGQLQTLRSADGPIELIA